MYKILTAVQDFKIRNYFLRSINKYIFQFYKFVLFVDYELRERIEGKKTNL